jgi:hypothetical protein
VRHAGGEDVPADVVRKAEQALAKAKGIAVQPWGERQAGLNDAVRDAAAAIQRHAGQHFDALAAELDDEARRSAERVNVALRALTNAYAEREHVAGRTTRSSPSRQVAAHRGSWPTPRRRSSRPWPKRCSTPVARPRRR